METQAPTRHALLTPDGREIQVRCWLPEGPARHAVVLSHGMGEHVDRYAPFARFCNEHAIAVFGANHRGHGKNAQLQGHYDDHQGWQKVIEDLDKVVAYAAQNTGLKVILMGHSMGSFVARQYAANYGDRLEGLILCGSNHQNPALFHLARLVARIQMAVQGKRHPSRLLGWLSFSQFNKTVKNAETDFDWLSRDREQVGKYIADPLCGFLCTTQFWYDFMGGLISINSMSTARQMSSELPVYLVAGDKDPVGRMGKGVQSLYRFFTSAGLKQVDINLYKNARHELFNETNRDEFYQNILNWITKTLPR
ncbi:alpha/beta hydrolase [Endozoicomonas acroporae]|uniref:alpha/beta hydrolase n=1 Tax=Endozoicomonas acroporae TaxID=1701104 RepID=UPI0013D2BB21|nr:alpha/beta hydrolase [Endozoicomonas acroporae]